MEHSNSPLLSQATERSDASHACIGKGSWRAPSYALRVAAFHEMQKAKDPWWRSQMAAGSTPIFFVAANHAQQGFEPEDTPFASDSEHSKASEVDPWFPS